MPFARAAFRLAAFLVVVFAAVASASDIGQEIAGQVSLTSYQHYLKDLLYTHNGNNRDAKTGPDHTPARDHMMATFESYGLDVELEPFIYSNMTCYNVVATQPGTVHADAFFIIGGHYDSAGTPGADDNASGVAGVLEIARILSTFQSEYTIKYIAFDTEEYGLLGSQAYVNAHMVDDIRGMISMDMIAYNTGNNLAEVSGFAACAPIKSALSSAITAYGQGLTFELITETSSRSDHGPFQSAGFQACLLIEDNPDSNPNYHKAADSVDTTHYINYNYAIKMIRSVAGYLADNAHVLHPIDCSTGQGCEIGVNGNEDCNANQSWDLCDIFCGLDTDVNANSIPDECEPHETWYVDAAAACPGSGTQASPFCTIQSAINAAANGLNAIVEIIVADGVYTGTGNKNLDFGGKLINLHSQNGPANCIIDCQGSGRGFYFHSGENSVARVDGFTIRNGNVTSSSPGGAYGGGVYCSGSSPTLANCMITGNVISGTSSSSGGGGVYCSGSRPTLTNCTISGNTVSGSSSSNGGGGLYCSSSGPKLTNCTINGNTAPTTGAVSCRSSSPTFTNCEIAGNTSRGVYCYGSSPALTDCHITANSVGGVRCDSYSSPSLVNCTISDNAKSGSSGLGGVDCYSYSNPTLTNCIISGNLATGNYGSGGGVYCAYHCSPTLTNCTISGNIASGSSSGGGGGVACRDNSSLMLTNCTISINTARAGGGVYCYDQSGVTLTNCTISGNTATGTESYGGGMYCSYDSNLAMTNCAINGNTASGTNGYGGGVYFYGFSSMLSNCAITGNTASFGGGLYYSSSTSSPTLTNCIIRGNKATEPYGNGGGLYCNGSSPGPTLTNCILWADTPQEIYLLGSGAPYVTYCDVQGGWSGTGNINADPVFAFADDFHIMPGSSCIDAGTNTPNGGLPTPDPDGAVRPLDGNGDGQAIADMGMYEFDSATPVIALSPSSFQLWAYSNGPNPDARALSIRNAGSGTLHWQIAGDASWLHISPASGVSAGEVNDVQLAPDITGLAPGEYVCTLTVSGAEPGCFARAVTVKLTLGNARRVPAEYATIQAAVDAAITHDWVLVADGIYTGTGNKDLDFHGKAITVRSASGDAAACIIDCQGSGRGFYFHTGETAEAVVDALTIRNGSVSSSSLGGANGGGVYCLSSNPTLTNCIVGRNTVTGSYGAGGGVYCEKASPTLTNCEIKGNTAFEGGGVFCYSSSSPTLTDCAIIENTAVGSSSNTGGGGVSCNSSSPTLLNCVISGNTARYDGGGVYCERYSSSPRLTNCTISRNTASGSGGGVYCYDSSSPRLTNCTINSNTADSDGGGIYCYNSSPTLTNCVLWDDAPQEIRISSGTPVVTFSDVQGGWTGTSNINIDPGFAFADDVHLVPGSACIDAGTNSPTGGLPTRDADGNPRPLDGNGDGSAVADMGAYEFNPSRPVIAISPSSIKRWTYSNDPDLGTEVLSIRNAGGAVLHWHVTADVPWLQISPAGGDSAGEVDEVQLVPDITGLAPGEYVGTLTVSGDEPGCIARTATVKLTIGNARRVPADYATIQEAIDAAITHDWVLVADGTYTGTGNKNLDFHGKAIIVRGASGDPATCIIDCQGSGRGFSFHSGETAGSVVEGFTIRKASASAISCTNSSNPSLSNCTISENTVSGDGGGLFCNNSSPTLTNCTISGNTTSGSGGGVHCYSSSSPTLTNCTISRNTASGNGGGVHCGSSSDPTLINCTISANAAVGTYGSGGGLYCYDYSDPTLTNCTIIANRAAYVGGGVCSSGYYSYPTLTNCILWGDTPDETYASSGWPVMTYCDVQGGHTGTGNINANPGFASVDDFHLMPGSPCIDTGTNSPSRGLPLRDADGNPRPVDGNGDSNAAADMGVYEFNPTTPVLALSPSSIQLWADPNNPASDTGVLSIRNAGGGILHWQIAGGASWLQVSPVEGDSAGEIDEVLLISDPSGLAPGRHVCMLTVSNAEPGCIARNVTVTLSVGNALFVPTDYATIQAAIDAIAQVGEIIVADGTYAGDGNKNLDSHGKAIKLRSASNNPAACIIDCQGTGVGFDFHFAEGPDSLVQGMTICHASSGGIRCSDFSSPTIRNCNLEGNSESGLRCASSSSPTLTECSITGNTGSYGGGVYSAGASSPTLINCAIRGNEAMSGGGGICCYTDGTATLINCTISGNTASQGGGVACYTLSNPVLTNCILWADTPEEIYVNAGPPLVSYSDIQGGWNGTGNINVDPAFAFATDFHLLPGSPCIDKGTNNPSGGLPTHDLDGNSRPLDGNGDGLAVADMGAHEFNSTAPVLAVSPPLVTFVALGGYADEKPKTLSIRNAGAGTLHWQIAGAASWLQVSAANGVSAGEINEVQLVPDISGLAPGEYACTLTISAAEPACITRTATVELTIGETRHVPADYATIQDAIYAATIYDWVLVADGTYTGPGNKDLDTLDKVITVRSASGNAAACIIDCQGSGRGFYFANGETAGTVVEGFTIRNASSGGVYCRSSSPTLTNCIISGNTSSDSGGGLHCGSGSNPTLTNCLISGNTATGYAGLGGGVYCDYSSNPTLVNCTISGNTASAGGGGVYCDSSSPTLTNCSISGNTTIYGGGGMYCTLSSPMLTNCIISGNTATGSGGGVHCYSSSSPTLANCVISRNTASGGGGLHCEDNSTPTLINGILWGDTPLEINVSSSSPVVTYCDIQGGWTGAGNLNTNPLFVDAVNGDYHLAANSPCIDAGDPASDYSLEPEPDGGRINMGAYGNTPEAECKGWLNIQSYGLVSKTRVGRTLFDYQLNVKIKNAGSTPAGNVVATLLSVPANVTIIDSQVNVGAIAAGATVTSAGTFTIRVDRSVPVSALQISWRVNYTAANRKQQQLLAGSIPRDALEPPPVPVPTPIEAIPIPDGRSDVTASESAAAGGFAGGILSDSPSAPE